MRPIPWWGIWLGLTVVVLVGGIAIWVLVSVFGSGNAQDKIRLEAIKLAGSIAVGTGGVAALLLAGRRQRASELGVLQKDREQLLQEHRDAVSRHDADERRVTELYTAAAEQLGSDKAPVRMAGLYALERLGKQTPDHRQTIVNLFCAYLRMPYTHPDSAAESSRQRTPDDRFDGSQETSLKQPLVIDLAPTLANAVGLTSDATDTQQQELQVRLTAQRLLSKHLRPARDQYHRATNPAYWGALELDLSGAVLDTWDFENCSPGTADFTEASFFRSCSFKNTEFNGTATFDRAKLWGFVDFYDSDFYRDARFFGAEFYGGARYAEVQFHRAASFSEASFHEHADFPKVRFDRVARFSNVNFHAVDFCAAHFDNTADFTYVTFHDDATFTGTTFTFGADLREAWARLDHGGRFHSTWPPGWIAEGYSFGVLRGEQCDGRWAQLTPA